MNEALTKEQKKIAKRKMSVSVLKKKAWSEFSRYIRTRDCLQSTGSLEFGTCYTCGKRYEFKQLQAGHFIPGRGNSVLFDDRGVHAQCLQCNCYDHGRWVEYEAHMLKDYGVKIVNELKANKHMIYKYQPSELLELIEVFKTKTRELEMTLQQDRFPL